MTLPKKENMMNALLWTVILSIATYVGKDFYDSLKEHAKLPKEAYDMSIDNSKQIKTIQEDFVDFKKEKERIDSAQWRAISRKRDR